jgi:O-antigen ligase/tetratricopeptide (TPR) repeat protein
MAVFFLFKEADERWSFVEKAIASSAGLVWLVVSIGLLRGKPMFASAFGTELLLVAIGLALIFFAQKKYALIALIALDAAMLFFSATRGAMLGLVGGALLAAFVYIVLEPRSRFAWRAGVGVVGLVCVAGLLWAARDTTFVQNVTPLQRLTTISTSESTFTGRKLNWGMAWKGVQEKPLLGWGQENYGLVFNKYFNPGMYGQEPWFDRVHEVLLDQMIAGGILGLIAYLLIHLSALLGVWSRAFNSLEKSILTGLMGGYFFYLLFTFDNITSWILFVALLGFVAVRTAQGLEKPILVPAGGLSRAMMPVVAIVTLIATTGVAWGVNADSIRANKALIRGVSPQQSGVQANLDAFKEAIAYNAPIGDQEIREHLVQGTTQLARANIPAEIKKQFLDLAATEMKALEDRVPAEARFSLFLGMLYNAYQQYPEGKAALERALVASPNKQGIMYELGSNLIASGDVNGALSVFKKAFEAAPSNNEARSLYAVVAIQAGNWDLAKEIAQPLIDADLAYGARVMNAYAAVKRYPEVMTIIKAHLEKKPDDVQAHFTLAAAHYLAGDKKTAIATLETLATTFPETAVQSRELIKQIKDGTLKVGQQ